MEATGSPLAEYCQCKSASALSRFLNEYQWSTRAVIKAVRSTAIGQILSPRELGRRPTLQVIIDLTTLEKVEKFAAFKHLIRVYNGKRGLHIVMLYLVVGQWRVPWSFRIYRGKDTLSPVQLGLRLLRGLSKALTQRFRVLVLADTAFNSIKFLEGVRSLKYHAIAGVSYKRKLQDGRNVSQLHKRGQQVRLVGLKFSVSLSWYYLKRSDGKRRNSVCSVYQSLEK